MILRRLIVFALLLLVIAPRTAIAQSQRFEVIPNVGHSSGVGALAFSPSSKLLVSGAFNGTLKIWEIDTGRLMRNIEVRSLVGAVAFSPDGQRILCGSADNAVRLWDVATGRLLRTFAGHHDRIISVAFSPGGKQIIAASRDQTVKLWDTASGRVLRRHAGVAANSLGLSPDEPLAGRAAHRVGG